MKTTNNTTFKRFIAFTASLMMAVSFASCGSNDSGSVTAKDPDNITEEEFEKAAEKLDSMSEEDFEKALEGKGGIDLGGDTDTGKTAEEEPAETKPEYEPCDEIKNADFTSGLIQIGNDVFKCGGYLTLREFVEKYGENWDCSGIDLNAEIPTVLEPSYKPIYDIVNKENNNLKIRITCLTRSNDIEFLKKREALFEEAYNEGGLYGVEKEKYIEFPALKYEWIMGIQAKLPDEDDSHFGGWCVQAYPDGSSMGDTIVYNICPFNPDDCPDSIKNGETRNATFYPKGIPMRTQNTDKQAVINFFKDNLGVDEMYVGESEREHGDFDLYGIYFPKTSNSDNKFSAYIMTSLFDNKIIFWEQRYEKVKYCKYQHAHAFTYNIKLKDKNLLGFEPEICLANRCQSDYIFSDIYYCDYLISENFTAGPYLFEDPVFE